MLDTGGWAKWVKDNLLARYGEIKLMTIYGLAKRIK
jgi:hypothetical protein